MSADLAPLGIEEGVVVRPGDTLVIRLSKDTSIEDFTRFRERALPMLKERLPGVEVVFLGGVEQIAVVRAGEAVEGDPT